jgi:alkylated DNA nucleotide flippase Atl1
MFLYPVTVLHHPEPDINHRRSKVLNVGHKLPNGRRTDYAQVCDSALVAGAAALNGHVRPELPEPEALPAQVVRRCRCRAREIPLLEHLEQGRHCGQQEHKIHRLLAAKKNLQLQETPEGKRGISTVGGIGAR